VTIKHQQLNNCTLITRHDPNAVTTSLGVWLRNGCRDESDNQTGFAHFMEHLVFKRTQLMSGKQLSTCFERMGGHINAETGREITAFHGTVPNAYSTELLEYFLQMLTRTAFDETDFNTERGVVMQELAMLPDDPEEALEDFATEQVLTSHPIGRQILGTVDTLTGSCTNTMHEYIKTVMLTTPVCIAATGNIDEQSLQQLIEKYLPVPTPDTSKEKTTPAFTSTQATLDLDCEQQHMVWVMPAIAYADAKHAAVEMANHMLAGGYDSRLYQLLREQLGLVYAIESRVDTYSDIGLWFIQTNTEKDNAAQVKQAVEQCLQIFIQQGPDETELQNTREHLKSSLIIEQDDRETETEKMARDMLYLERITQPEERLQAYDQVDAQAIQAVLMDAWKGVSYFNTV